MNCEKYKLLLSPYFDRELDLATRLSVEAHLKACVVCQAQLHKIQVLSETIRSTAPMFELDPDLEKKILSKQGIAEEARFNRKQFSLGFGSGILATCMAAAVFAFILFSPNHNSELLSMHLRSLQPGHLVEIESSNHHVIKPWLAGKLDFTFNPEDYESQGFKLVGARTENFHGDRCVALVYQRRAHIVNVLVRKNTIHFGSKRQSTVNGFNILEWSKDELSYSAISDIAPSDLEELQQMIEK